MGREVPSGLQPLLDLPSCETQTTLDLYLTNTDEYHFSTADLDSIDIGTDTVDYTSDLRSVDIIKQSIAASVDRVSAVIQNVDKAIGIIAAAEALTHAVAVVGRYYYDPTGAESPMWVELFRGEAFPGQFDENKLPLEIINDLAACGYCVADWTLMGNCQLVFKDADTCGYSGGETACNKKRRSPDGCFGRANEHHFGGMEFPDFQVATVDSAGTGDTGDGQHHNCPRVDQYVLVERGLSAMPGPLRVSALTLDHRLYNPVTKTFHRIKSLRIVERQQIWRVTAENGAESYSSRSHLVLWYREHVTGEPVKNFVLKDPVLTTIDERLDDSSVAIIGCINEAADVMAIEMEDGHIYAAGNDPDKMVVCHNKAIDEDYYN